MPIAKCRRMNPHFQADSFTTARAQMVRTQLADRGIRDPRVLQAMLDVPRHEFVPEELRSEAYDDRPLPIGAGQTISQPYIVALMLQHLALQSNDRVLDVGTGSGYVAALLSRICSEVYSVERYSELAASAERLLQRLGYANVKVIVGDGTRGLPEHAPFDAILVSAAAALVPPALFDQLRDGGRLIVPVGSPFSQELQLVRQVNGKREVEYFEGCRFVPLVSEEESQNP